MNIKKKGSRYLVESALSKGKYYEVDPDLEHPFCTCPNFIFRGVKTGRPCKHIEEVRKYLKKATSSQES
jgi:predicted nucleic acid-binding Zn finger protein